MTVAVYFLNKCLIYSAMAECAAKNRPQEISLTARIAEFLAWVCIMILFLFLIKNKKIVRPQGEKRMLQKKPKPQLAGF